MQERDDGGPVGDSRLERQSRAVFDQSVADLDAATRSRLNQARQAALAELKRGRAWQGGWLPAGALAAAAVLAVALWTGREPAPGAAPAVAAVFEDFELVTAEEDLEMLGEDLEFYAWAADELAGGVG